MRQKKTGRPVRFELTEQTREAVDDYIRAAGKKPGQFLFAGRRSCGRAISTRQYDPACLAHWIAGIWLDPSFFGTHSLRRTKATLIYRRIPKRKWLEHPPTFTGNSLLPMAV